MGFGAVLLFDIVEIGQHSEEIAQDLHIQRITENRPAVRLGVGHAAQGK